MKSKIKGHDPQRDAFFEELKLRVQSWKDGDSLSYREPHKEIDRNYRFDPSCWQGETDHYLWVQFEKLLEEKAKIERRESLLQLQLSLMKIAVFALFLLAFPNIVWILRFISS